MKLKFSVEDEMFRQELRQFFESEYPQDIRQKVAAGVTIEKQEYQRSDAALAARGWSAPAWPKEYGGPGWSVVQCYIFDEELERAGALNPIPSGLIYLGPVVYTFGTEDQKKQWLPGILDGTTQWAQGYSEPNAGSDLASLRTTAVHDGDGYIVNGEKVWTTYAHLADWIFCLVRTDSSGPKQQGISFLCMDLSSPGITVQPIPSIDGKHHLNRVIFDNVRVPLGNRIGEEGKGWKYANFLLGHERISYAHIGAKKRDLQQLKAMALSMGTEGKSLLDQPLFAAKLARAEINLRVLEYTTLRVLSSIQNDSAAATEPSIIKIMASESAQEISTLYLEAMGPEVLPLCEDWIAQPWFRDAGISEEGPRLASKYFFDRTQTIYGGSNEIQRNVLAKRVLGI